jgi:NTP pyrophosphatase (non-canonical NTP hydrolase)
MALEIFNQAIEKWGKEAQTLVAIEELCELSQALIHSMRKNKNITKEEIAGEVADVYIVLEQVKLMFDIEDKVSLKLIEKLTRLNKYIEEE